MKLKKHWIHKDIYYIEYVNLELRSNYELPYQTYTDRNKQPNPQKHFRGNRRNQPRSDNVLSQTYCINVPE